jgi:glutamate-1-semialdehyde 2,1-aminomutase
MSTPLIVAAAAGIVLLPKARARLLLSRAKHPSLTGHARMSSRLAKLLPAVRYEEARIFDADGAPQGVIHARRQGLQRLAQVFTERYPRSRAMAVDTAQQLSDMQLTSRYRVPFQFSDYIREKLPMASFIVETRGDHAIDVDGNELADVAGAYGVNVFGYDFYKACMAEAQADASQLGPVLGTYHPRMLEVLAALRKVSGMDEVSFHMSGTEAVMQAVRVAQYNSMKRKIVRFCGAYHGFWGEVQPGVGNPMPARDTLTLADMSPLALEVLRTRRDIACVLINPLQGLHPNRAAPADSGLLDSSRTAGFDREAYTQYLREIRRICTDRGIALIFDEVFMGFRLARGGAQEYFGVQADLVTYGKTLGGGFPVGVVCGKARWMRRFREDAPADICFARGTFNAHPTVVAAMHAFLKRLDSPEVLAVYHGLDERWRLRMALFNARMDEAKLPVRAAGMSSVWTILYGLPNRYNWMLQYYLRAEGLLLSWVGTGRLIFNAGLSDAEFDDMCARFLRAARTMQEDGFFWCGESVTDRDLRRDITRELVLARLARLWPGRGLPALQQSTR